MSFSAREVFDKWLGTVQEDASLRYLGVNRKPVLDELAQMLFVANVDYSEAKMLSREVVNKLTTEEGRKGKGKYKGWAQTVEEDFRIALASYFVEVDIKTSRPETTDSLPNDELITAWGLNKFGELWDDRLSNMAHQVGSPLNLEFMSEVFSKEFLEDYAIYLKKD